MRFERLKIPDIILCKPTIFQDDRGYFFESFRKDLLEDFLNLTFCFCQENESYSIKGILRGLHYQIPPFAQSKWVSVLQGTVLDIAVDMRKGSPTFGKSISVVLSCQNKQRLFIPRGFAHGFLVLSDTAIFKYLVDNPYSAEHDRGIFYADPKLNINWQMPDNQIQASEKDKKHPLLDRATLFDFNENLYA